MTVHNVLAQRNIRELMHFTTNSGLVGSLHHGSVLSRQRLPKEKYLSHICTFNCDVRKDKPWLDYVSLSVSWINPRLFDISANNWHKDKDLWWCILSFDASIAEDDGVYFVQTNNMYTGARQATGVAGLEALFAPTIVPYTDRYSGRPIASSVIRRPTSLPAHLPTDPQAEVLYPKAIGIDNLVRVYVRDEELADAAQAAAHALDREINVVVRPELFSAHSPRV